MSAEYHPVSRRDLVELVDKDHSLLVQLVDDEFVMDDFPAHVQGFTIRSQSQVDDVNGADDASAEPKLVQLVGLTEAFLLARRSR